MHHVKARIAPGKRAFGALRAQMACERSRGCDARVTREARRIIGEQGSGEARRSADGGGDARYLQRGGRETQVCSPSS